MAKGLNSERRGKVYGVHAGISERGTNGTWLQLVRSCTVQFDQVFLISKLRADARGATGYRSGGCTMRRLLDEVEKLYYNIRTE